MRRFVLSVVVLGLFALPSWGQTNKALDIVPDDALGFILIKDIRQLHDKAEDLAGKANGKAYFAFMEGMLSKEIKKGMNEKGSVVVIVMAGRDEKTLPCPILALAAGDPAVLMQALGVTAEAKDGISSGAIDMPKLPRFGFDIKEQPKDGKMPIVAAKRDGFVLLTSAESREQLQRVLSAKKSIASSVESAKTWLDEQDISATCAPAGRKAALPFLPKIDGQPFIKDVEKNVNFVALGARIDKTGDTRLLARIFFNADSPYAKRTGKAEPAGIDPKAVVFLKVDDASAFVEGATDLMKKHSEATNAVGDTHTDVKIQPSKAADKQSVLITVTTKSKDAKEPDSSPPDTLIMTIIDPQTLLVGNLKNADQAESFIKAHVTKPAKSLEGNGELKKTFALLPKQTQLAAFINLKNILDEANLKACPPLGFGVSMLPGSIEAQLVLPIETLQALVEADNARNKAEPEKK